MRVLVDDLSLSAASVGRLLADRSQAPSPSDVEALLAEFHVLYDLDVLMWPALKVSVESLFRSLARRGPRIWVWPGTIEGGHARYGISGRPDYHDVRLSDTIVLRPLARRFPDEVPYAVERIGS